MSNKLVECIPNFSEGRRPEVIQAIREAISAEKTITILDQHSDHDHNRTVITFAGPPEAVAKAAFAGIAKAAEWIDMDQHRGEHPRLGATDVVPFVPLQGSTMQDCISLARSLGARVAQELDIPVYFYEAAAVLPERINLENIRRGEYEALKAAIADDPLRAPDLGPKKLGKAGACIIGARPPLIAFNVYLTTDEVSIAKKVARAVRHSSGGLRYVKALGLLVDGRAQVSMNLTDYRKTPIARVVEMIRSEAHRYGVSVHHSELVGLSPQRALIDAAQHHLQLEEFEEDQLLEQRLQKTGSPMDESSFLEQLAEGSATPGGGSAAAYAGAMGAALVGMVARLTLGRKKYDQVQEEMQEITEKADQLRISLEAGVAADSEAFDQVMDAYRMPKGSPEEKAARAEAIERATHHAAEVPLAAARQALEVLELAAQVAETGNSNAITDAGSAGAMALAAMQSAGMNVRINASSVKDQGAAASWRIELSAIEEQAYEYHQALQQTIKSRAGLTS